MRFVFFSFSLLCQTFFYSFLFDSWYLFLICVSYYLFIFILVVDPNEIEDHINNYNDKNQIVCEDDHANESIPINNTTMICINDQPQLIVPSYGTENAERTISSSSSEPLIPKEKQTGKKR